MKKRGHYDSINEDYHINISANSNTLKSFLILEKDYQVDFNHQNSLAKVLGFTGTKYTGGFHESENVVDLLSINSILVNIDLISGSFVNGTTKNTIYSFFPKVSPGYKIIDSPVNLVYVLKTVRGQRIGILRRWSVFKPRRRDLRWKRAFVRSE